MPILTMHPLKRRRFAAGLTLEAFSKRLSVSIATVNCWERGKSIPSAGMFPKIAKVLEVTPMEVTEMVCPSIRLDNSHAIIRSDFKSENQVNPELSADCVGL